MQSWVWHFANSIENYLKQMKVDYRREDVITYPRIFNSLKHLFSKPRSINSIGEYNEFLHKIKNPFKK
ncbi:hypothetical protein CO154_02590 [Candidatus Pacearchaeota archaeon CG_4_9_14_3_um_filter_31_7]|nr:MAG: hypothetical protein COX99_02300 [Candidatus Pacearchaeota archaeon CG_4_10_14_0_2_um_filter_31_10]PJA70496.1 MAG: hypothetical protein CO154_02590 [Candidatus Pacearchaeota archaeon CG_4_9_14_3_um_filter_31_7]